jgi:putative flavoprotein involved in K+ transport
MTTPTQHFDTVIIGGGQAGLATGYHLARSGRSFVILDAHERVGDAWRQRWDSLRLFTPARRDGLPGMRFPAPAFSFPTKDEMADYLEAYAERFELPVRTGVRVDAVGRSDGQFIVAAGDERYAADNVVVACGAFEVPYVPPFAAELAAGIVQMHAEDYRNESQLADGPVLVVGPGNSGADVALDVAGRHRTFLSGKHPGHIPINTVGLSGRLAFPVLWQVWTHILNVGTPIGRKVRANVLRGPEPLIRVKPKHLDAAGVERVGRTIGVREGLPLLEDERTCTVANVIWATGYRTQLDWLDLPAIADPATEPETERGVVAAEPGLYFVGRKFLYAFNSHTIGGVGRDAAHIVRHITSRAAEPHARPAARSGEYASAGAVTSG